MGADAPEMPVQAVKPWLQYRLDVVEVDGHGQFVLGSHASARYGSGGHERVEVPGFDPEERSTSELYEALVDCLDGERAGDPPRRQGGPAVGRFSTR